MFSFRDDEVAVESLDQTEDVNEDTSGKAKGGKKKGKKDRKNKDWWVCLKIFQTLKLLAKKKLFQSNLTLSKFASQCNLIYF